MSDPKLPSCVEPWWPNKTARDYARECVTTEDSIADALAAAEERGRRRGVEERDELRAAIRVALQHLSRVGTEPGFPVYEASKILSAALAPRDSGPASIPEGAVHHDCPLVGCQIIGKHEHRIEGPAEARK